MDVLPHDRLSIRPLCSEDTEGIVALYDACMVTEPGIGQITAGIWSYVTQQARFGFGRDFRVAFYGPDLIGLAESSFRGHGTQVSRFVKIIVNPAHRRRGLGTRLLQIVVDQGSADRPVLIETMPRPDWTAGIAFASSFGFAVTESEIVMRCSDLRPVGDGPAGLVIACTDPGTGAERAAAIHNAAYRSEAGFVLNSKADMLASLKDAQLWTACLGGTIVAFAIIEREADLVWLESLAVDPHAKGCGIGGALAFRALWENGAGRKQSAGLSVSSINAAARKLYARLGFADRSARPRYGCMRDDLLTRLAAR